MVALNRELVARAEAIDSPRRIVLDMDNTEVAVYGQQEQSAYNGHFESTCYHPLLLFNREGDCLAAKLEKTLEPNHRLVARPSHWPRQQLRDVPLQIVVRRNADRILHLPFFQRLVQLRLGKGRIGAEDYLLAQPLLAFNLGQQQFLPALGTVDVARPYQAVSWTMVRRVVAKLEFHCGELFPRVGFIVTSLAASSRAVVRFYNKRGTAEQWIKEGKRRSR